MSKLLKGRLLPIWKPPPEWVHLVCTSGGGRMLMGGCVKPFSMNPRNESDGFSTVGQCWRARLVDAGGCSVAARVERDRYDKVCQVENCGQIENHDVLGGRNHQVAFDDESTVRGESAPVNGAVNRQLHRQCQRLVLDSREAEAIQS
jgi:hypothetical protein